MHRCLAAPLMIAAALAPAMAWAQYRDGGPQVMAPPPLPPDPARVAAQRFDAVYAARRSPRIIIFWNRDFDEDVASEYENRHSEHEVESTTSNQLDEQTAGPAGTLHRTEGGTVRERRLEGGDGLKRVRPAQRARVGTEAVDWQLEDGFSQQLLQHGARLVDRKLSMRLTGARSGAGERANMQEIEMRAAAGYAEIMLSVRQTQDLRAVGMVTFQVTATDLRTARVIARFSTTARPRAPRMPFVVGPEGLVRATPPEPGPGQIAAQLGVETLAALADGLGAAGG